MVDSHPDFETGEYMRGAMLETVELAEALTAADAGKALKATGINTDGQLKVAKQTAMTAPIAVAIKETVGAIGDLVQVLIRGDVKIGESSGAIVVGGAITAVGGKFAALGAGSSFTQSVGFARAPFAAAGTDKGLICFSGP